MIKECMAVRVYTSDAGYVCLEQADEIDQILHKVILHPDQCELVIRWMKESLKEIEGSAA